MITFYIHLHNFECILSLLVVTVMFSQSLYTVTEDAGSAQLQLVLSNILSIVITVEVFNTDGSASGVYCSILSNYINML